MVPSLPLLSCESSVSVKKTLIEKKKFLLSLNIFSICFQWFMLLLPIVCFPFSSSTSQSSTCFVVSSSFLQRSFVSLCCIFSFILVFTSLCHFDFFHFSALSLFIPILSPISLALSYSVFVIPFFLCSKIIFCDILSLLLLIILWINIIVEYSILSFAGHMPVSISNPVEGVGTGSCSIFFND